MKKVLFVCMGNICRSPLAEGILKHKLHERSVNALVDSAGIGNWHVGMPPDERAIKEALLNGVDISDLVARQFSRDDFDKFDKIYVVDREVGDYVKSMARNEDDTRKIDFLMNPLYPGKFIPVPDPYFGLREDFEKVYSMLDEACEKIADLIVKSNLNEKISR